MRYATFAVPDEPERAIPGVLIDNRVISLQDLQKWGGREEDPMPASMFELIHAGEAAWGQVERLIHSFRSQESSGDGGGSLLEGHLLEDVILYAPLPRPLSLRDFYAFEAHVSAANEIRGRDVPEEWYRFPVFYFTNPNTIFGPGESVPHPSYTQAMDYELEVACIIGKPGINIPEERAEEYIFGYTIFNDWSARDVQRMEMKVGLGPAKGKDFASSLGPVIVTPDELIDRSTGRPGVYDLTMKARVNGEERSAGNWKDLHYSFGEMIARASEDVYLLPGEVLGSGTVGTGCLLELTRANGPWLKHGDTVELEIERLGVLKNYVARMMNE
jgi:fumarylacetoacetate (FAA) hydrolase